ncbi:MAG: exo-alpha-sialidase [Phycisphaerales bacterium]|nr:exo-alpha-sialidase [Phycisphaerales bacterium]
MPTLRNSSEVTAIHQMNSTPSTKAQSAPPLTIQRQVVLNGRRNNQCWFSPATAAVPTASGMQIVINVHQLTGNDCGPMHTIVSRDMGRSWCPPFESQNQLKIPLEDDIFESVHTPGLMHLRKSGRTLAFSSTVFTRDRNINPLFKTEWFVSEKAAQIAGAFAWWDPNQGDFTPSRKFDVPQIRARGNSPLIFGLNQCCELADGSILMPLGEYRPDKTASVGTMRLSIDGDELTIDHVGPMIGDKFYEPSIVEYGGRYYMTIRSERRDGRMYRAVSRDGLEWTNLDVWSWDDGSPVQTANTQQHWMKLGDALYLVYTRKSELNNGVYRFRAPLFMARVDPAGPCLIRESEQIVFEEKGARMGNFSICRISENESWIVTGEWLQQMIPGYRPDQVGFTDSGDDPSPYNRLVYRGDLLLARIRI